MLRNSAPTIFCLLAIIANNSFAMPSVKTSHVEDFSSWDYCDTTNTSALWDIQAGQIRLPLLSHASVDSLPIPGTAIDILIAGNWAYVAGGEQGLQVIDMSDPESLELVAGLDTPGNAIALSLEGDVLAIADQLEGVHFIDISDPAAPAVLSTLDTPGEASGIQLVGSLALVADGLPGVQVVDYSDPSSPSIVASCNTPGSALDLVWEGDALYVADGSAGFQVMAFTNPTNPEIVANIPTMGHCYDVVAICDLAYLAEGEAGLKIVDLSDPFAPQVTANLALPGNVTSLQVDGDFAYLGSEDSGLAMVDVSVAGNPRWVTTIAGEHFVGSVDRHGEYLLCAMGVEGLWTIMAGEGMELTQVYGTNQYGASHWIETYGDLAFIGQSANLHILDIRNPMKPVLHGTLYAPNHQEEVVAAGDRLYIANAHTGLSIADISDPENPTMMSTVDTPDFAEAVKVRGDLLYLAEDELGLMVYDVSDPYNPTVMGAVATPGYSSYIALDGNYVYVADTPVGLSVVDISNPDDPQLVANHNHYGNSQDLKIEGNLLYIGALSHGAYILDIADPLAPFTVANIDAYRGRDVAVFGDLCYISAEHYGIQAADLSDPSQPIIVESLIDESSPIRMSKSGDYLYVGQVNSDDGFRIFKILERQFDLDRNIAQSEKLNEGEDLIYGVRYTTAQHDSIHWETTADGGFFWRVIHPGTGYLKLPFPGNDLRWKAVLPYAGEIPLTGPICDELQVDWLYGYGVISSAEDVPDDEGGELRLSWLPSGLDLHGASPEAVSYKVLRKADGRSKCREDWEEVASLPAVKLESYTVVVPTHADSTLIHGMWRSTYLVRTLTTDPVVFFDSPPDSGYSVDNLAPPAPEYLVVVPTNGGGMDLSWSASPAEDLLHYKIYRGSDPEFPVDPEHPLATSISTAWTDSLGNEDHFYRVAAVDSSGNEGALSEVGYVVDVDQGQSPTSHALLPNVPNPFNPSTLIHFEIGGKGAGAKIEIFDSSGRRVRLLLDAWRSAGRQSIRWDGKDDAGKLLSSGLYHCRLCLPGFGESRKLVLLK